MDKISKRQFTTGVLWKVTEAVATKGVSFIVSLILARLLAPADYGIIALTTIFTSLSDVLIDGGFSTTLIRKKTVDKYDYSCVFTVSLGLACILYFLLFFGAPVIASYYDEPLLKAILRVVGLVVFIQAFSSTRNAVIHRTMQFKLLVLCNTIGSVISGVLGIAAALAGLGVWALVIQQLSQQIIVTILLFAKIHWKFVWNFQWSRFKEILSFSIGVMGATLLSYVGASLYNLIVGKRYSVSDLGYSNKGEQLPKQVSLYTFSAMSSVLLPALSSYQDEKETFKRVFRKVINMTAYLIFPMMLGMAVVSKELITVLLTDKWMPALRIMQFDCIYYIATPFMLINVQAFYALGYGFKRVKTEIVRLFLLAISLIVFLFGLKCSISELALVSAIIAVINAFHTYLEVKRLIQYQIVEALKDIYKPCCSAIVMGMIVVGANMLLKRLGIGSDLVRLIIDVCVGAFVYLFLSIILKMDGYIEIKRFIKDRKNNVE